MVKPQHKEILQQVLPALQTKMSEFKYYDYHAISLEDLWNYCVEKKWRKKLVEDLKMYEIVATILSVSPSEVVSHGQLNEFKTADWFSELNKEEFQSLFKNNKV